VIRIDSEKLGSGRPPIPSVICKSLVVGGVAGGG
jgi:hypothetical protein